MKLIEKSIYKLKVGLFAKEWNVKQGMLGSGSIARGYVYFDHYNPEHGYLFGLLHEHSKYYVVVPDEYLEDYIEEVKDDEKTNI